MSSPPNTLADLVNHIIGLINLMIPVLIAVAFLVIVWKLVDSWIINAGDEKKHAEGRVTLTVGIIVLAIISSLWGILAILRAGLFG